MRILKDYYIQILIFALAIVLVNSYAMAQDDDTLRIEIVRSNLQISIAIPYLETPVPQYSDFAREIALIVREDLKREPIFSLADPLIYTQIGQHSHSSISSIPFDRYNNFKIDAALLGKIVPAENGQANTVRVESRLFSIRDKSTLFGKGITANTNQVRQIAHVISSNILYHFTGDFGIYRSKIYFTSTNELPANTENAEIWSMDFDGHNQRRLTYSESLKLFPSIGPAGSGLVYTSFINNNADVYLLKAEGGDATTVFGTSAADMTPAISPDGTRIAFSSSIRGGNTDIYTCNLNGTDVKRLTTHRAIDSSPCWSPDGRQIAFTSGRTGTVQIYVMNADGSNQRRITYEGRYNDGADWSPDGRYIAYSSRRSGSKTFDVKIHDLTTDQTYYVTRDVENDENPSFSPSGNSIVFASDRTGNYQIWTVDIDGKNMRQLTRTGVNKHPSWSK